MKKWIFFLSLTFIFGLSAWLMHDLSRYQKLEQGKFETGAWQTYNKLDKKISSYPTTPKEAQEAKLNTPKVNPTKKTNQIPSIQNTHV